MLGFDEDAFNAEWRSLESPARRVIARLANRGASSDDPYTAALVLGFARQRLHPIESWGVIGAIAVGYTSVTHLFFGGADALIVALLVAVLTFLFSIRRTWLERAIERSEKSLRRAAEEERRLRMEAAAAAEAAALEEGGTEPDEQKWVAGESNPEPTD